MKRIALIIGAGVMSCTLLAGCGGDHHTSGGTPPPPPPPPPPSMTKDLDTAAVLAIVQTQTSETADPFEVDNAAIAVTPIGDETSSPVSVDAT
ncbi:MAG TPA: hypothetical protein VK580_18470 [Steroidobacteraceae bacterium]|jgi:hypothetical protein|nr:hypothetical protein [Steroidobacteraceae bacterium]